MLYIRLVVMFLVSLWVFRFGFWWGLIALLITFGIFFGERHSDQEVQRKVKANMEKEFQDDLE